MSITVLCYEKCSTCKKALKWLDDNNIEYTLRPIKDQNPSAAELKAWHEKSGLPLKRFYNTSGLLYKELGLKDRIGNMSVDEQYELLSGNGMLVKRPLVVAEDIILTGFKESEWERLKAD